MIELRVVIVIIAILASCLPPGVNDSFSASKSGALVRSPVNDSTPVNSGALLPAAPVVRVINPPAKAVMAEPPVTVASAIQPKVKPGFYGAFWLLLLVLLLLLLFLLLMVVLWLNRRHLNRSNQEAGTYREAERFSGE